jgi:hypothetical protein
VRPVPRRDAGHHAERLAQRHREGTRLVRPDDLAHRQVAPVRRLPEQPDGGDDLEAGEGAGAAGLGGEQLDDLVPPPFDDVGGAQEHRLLVSRRQFGPGREGRRRGVDRPDRVGPGTRRDPRHHGASVRVEVVEHLVRADPFPADVLPVLAQRSSSQVCPPILPGSVPAA